MKNPTKPEPIILDAKTFTEFASDGSMQAVAEEIQRRINTKLDGMRALKDIPQAQSFSPIELNEIIQNACKEKNVPDELFTLVVSVIFHDYMRILFERLAQNAKA